MALLQLTCKEDEGTQDDLQFRNVFLSSRYDGKFHQWYHRASGNGLAVPVLAGPVSLMEVHLYK